ncbi:MAG: Ppx/GppA phosphatase family protein [Bacteroidota bacterium]
MPVIAAVDVGSNAIRLAIAEAEAEDRITVLENVRDPVRLGQDVFTSGSIAEETMDRAVETFRGFRVLMDKHGVRLTKAVATSATREAFNREIFVDRVSQASGVDIEAVGPEEEARLIHRAVSARINLRNRLALLVDIGGGSVEITLTRNDEILSTESFRMGAVRLLQVLEEKKHGERHFNRLVQEYVEAARKRIVKEVGEKPVDLCVGTGGNIESLADLRRELFPRKGEAGLTREELDALIRKLQGMSFDGRVQQLRLRPDRADVIVPAAIVLQKILRLAGADAVQIPGVGLKDGLLRDMAEELYGSPRRIRRDQVLGSALQLGRKYAFDEQHGLTVARWAVRLFDEARTLHNLGAEHRLLLETAALLHDIGQFVSVSDHHKHSHYLLTAAPVIGLSREQMAVVANVARYHRKSMPKPQHESYALLPSRDRVVVSKLASLLRLADAMDNEHASRVKDFAVEFRKPRFTLALQGEGDLLLEKWALVRKAPMFEQVFSVKFALVE